MQDHGALGGMQDHGELGGMQDYGALGGMQDHGASHADKHVLLRDGSEHGQYILIMLKPIPAQSVLSQKLTL